MTRPPQTRTIRGRSHRFKIDTIHDEGIEFKHLLLDARPLTGGKQDKLHAKASTYVACLENLKERYPALDKDLFAVAEFEAWLAICDNLEQM